MEGKNCVLLHLLSTVLSFTTINLQVSRQNSKNYVKQNFVKRLQSVGWSKTDPLLWGLKLHDRVHRSRQWTRPCAKRIPITPTIHLKASLLRRPRSPGGLFLSGFPTNIVYATHLSHETFVHVRFQVLTTDMESLRTSKTSVYFNHTALHLRKLLSSTF
jgi:hypothetical protein